MLLGKIQIESHFIGRKLEMFVAQRLPTVGRRGEPSYQLILQNRNDVISTFNDKGE